MINWLIRYLRGLVQNNCLLFDEKLPIPVIFAVDNDERLMEISFLDGISAEAN